MPFPPKTPTTRPPSGAQSLRRLADQRGISIVGLILLVAVIGLFAIVGLRVAPTFVEFRAIQSAVKKAKASANSVAEIQKAFDRSAAIDDITTLSGKDLDIVKIDDDLVVSFAYTKKVPIFGPVSLAIDYAGNSKSL